MVGVEFQVHMLGLDVTSMLFPLCMETTDFDALCITDAAHACVVLQLCLVHNLRLLSFVQVVSSAIVDKYIGESARLIREMFGYAKEHQPCIIFMDEIDAIGGRRFSEGTSADREIQRTLMELLSQLDGFDVVGKVELFCVAAPACC